MTLFAPVQKSNIQFFADGTNLLLDNENVHDLHINVNAELEAINKWIKRNKLRLNISKSTYLIFQNRSVSIDMPPVILDGAQLVRVRSTKFLGVFIDEYLNWKCQINSVITKLSRFCGILYRIRNNLTPEALISIYYTLCYPHFLYCVSIWACTWPSFVKPLQIAQNKIFRCIFYKKKFDSTHDVLSTYKFLNFSSIHKYSLLLHIYKCLTQQGGTPYYKIVHTSHNTRSNNVNLISPQYRTVLFNNSMFCSGPSIWNCLPVDIKSLVNCGSLSQFKRSLKTHLLSLQINQI